MDDAPSFTVVSIDRHFRWGSVCRLEIDGNYSAEENKLGWDEFQAPKLMRRAISLKARDTITATLMIPELKPGDRFSAIQLITDLYLWSEWQ
ncbi:hypothetical protein GCM10007973_09410 [Polymorphobacter multimanifer]|uniref:Uncharacterized protein n=1 Tax=Polymorphobacter multimanifer TaxID=1070431 RepID=A0A841LGX0_9SPHN|nr:hypothetical protein [Polymorphobacter multimanifer]MBB6228442.1 hypothetical protein [Polymorphobacter multimanifer]GGI74641.1 hypothetical protein GCM10007973_09410 [Polymorphobacter multimanifer]